MIIRIFNKSYRLLKAISNRLRSRGKRKYFCIGQNKTGTTSVKKAFEDLGFPVGDQGVAQRIADKYYFCADFQPIIEYCKSAQVFQDIPFSFPDTFKYLDQAFPGSKFILTVRDDGEQWYKSLIGFHSKVFGNGIVPSAECLQEDDSFIKGFWYKAVKLYGAPDEDIYNKEILIDSYNRYNKIVMEYFKNRPNDLLILNVAEKCSYTKFVEFLGIKPIYDDFPWENKT